MESQQYQQHTHYSTSVCRVYISYTMNAFGAISASRISLQGLLYRIDARDSLVSASIDVDQGIQQDYVLSTADEQKIYNSRMQIKVYIRRDDIIRTALYTHRHQRAFRVQVLSYKEDRQHKSSTAFMLCYLYCHEMCLDVLQTADCARAKQSTV